MLIITITIMTSVNGAVSHDSNSGGYRSQKRTSTSDATSPEPKAFQMTTSQDNAPQDHVAINTIRQINLTPTKFNYSLMVTVHDIYHGLHNYPIIHIESLIHTIRHRPPSHMGISIHSIRGFFPQNLPITYYPGQGTSL